MRTNLIVGGDITIGKPSGIINKIGALLPGPITIFNGVLPCGHSVDQDLVIWMPNIDNEVAKVYPKKKQGSVLICSKVMREGYTHIDSVSRIFKMGANAVIEIYFDDDGYCSFELRDALNNLWGERTADLLNLVDYINELYTWTKGSIRKSLNHSLFLNPQLENTQEVEQFLKLNEELSLKVADHCGNRFFGNYSTRCTSLFPNIKARYDWYFFSGRNTSKQVITLKDLVGCTDESYVGNNKPSVDAPVQIEIYKQFPNLKYMIHGHAYIKDKIMTTHYYPCGDMREVDEVIQLLKRGHREINLKNHGFLFVAGSLEEMVEYAEDNEFNSL